MYVKNYKFCIIYFNSGLNNITNTLCLTNTKGAIAKGDLLPVVATAGVVGRPTSIQRTNERTTERIIAGSKAHKTQHKYST